MLRWMAAGSVVLLVTCLAAPAWAQASDDQEDLKTTVEALKQRIKDQDRRLAELEDARHDATTQPVSQAEREAIKSVMAEMKADADKKPVLPTWMDNLKFAGDFRLRYDYENFDWGSKDGKEKKDRNRARFRLRFGATKTWLEDQLEVGFRLASGSGDSAYNANGSDGTSTNQTFDGDFSKKPVWIDLAYAKYAPKDLKGFSVTGGKMIRPWATNDIFWDSDVNPDGFWAQYTVPKVGPIEPFVGAGYFVLKESADDNDSSLAIYQAGVKADVTKDVKYTFAANFQDWDRYDISGATPRGNDSPLSRVPGFRIINLTNNVDIASVFGHPLNLFGDFARNVGEGDTAGGDKYHGQDDAFAVGAMYGQNKKKGDWSVKYRYAYVEANALPGAFVDSDFGFGNRKGHVIGGTYNLLDSLTVGVSVYLTEPVFSPTTTSGSSSSEDLTTTVLADMVWKF